MATYQVQKITKNVHGRHVAFDVDGEKKKGTKIKDGNTWDPLRMEERVTIWCRQATTFSIGVQMTKGITTKLTSHVGLNRDFMCRVRPEGEG